MIGKLQIIFGADPVALALRIRGQVLVLFKQLGSVAARATVDAIAVVGATTAATLARTTAATATIIIATAATTTGLPIVDQAVCPLAKRKRAPKGSPVGQHIANLPEPPRRHRDYGCGCAGHSPAACPR